jgi:hypothetical protein
MGTPYDREFIKTTTAVDEVVELDFPGRCELNRISILRVSGGDIDAGIFNRKFVGATHAVALIEPTGNGTELRIALAQDAAPLNDVKVGDLVTVAGNSNGAYNVATHRIVAIDDADINDPRWIDTDNGGVSSPGTGGTVQLDITTEQELQRVLPDITGSGSVLEIPPGTGDIAVFRNQDPVGNVNIGVKRKLYMKFADAGTYKIGLSAILGVAGEG